MDRAGDGALRRAEPLTPRVPSSLTWEPASARTRTLDLSARPRRFEDIGVVGEAEVEVVVRPIITFVFPGIVTTVSSPLVMSVERAGVYR